MKQIFFYTALLVGLSACHAKPVKNITDSVAVYKVPDEQSIDKAVHAAYAAINFKMGSQPKYDLLKKCFIPQARFINLGGDSAQITNIDQFIYLYRTHVEADGLRAFNETEIYGKTEQFGRIAERISTYRTEIIRTDTTEERGVNSFQLIKTNNGWKVSSIIWDKESQILKIPGYYFGKKYTDSLQKTLPKPKRWVVAKDTDKNN